MYEHLRSRAAVSRANTPHALRFPYDTKVALDGLARALLPSGRFEPDAARVEEWNRGAYLVAASATATPATPAATCSAR